MKKNSSRIVTAVLVCIPLLLASSATLVQANDNNNNSNKDSVLSLNITKNNEDINSTKESTNTLLPIAQGIIPIETTIDGKGSFALAKFKDIDLTGEFVPKKSDTLTIDAKGNWIATKAGTEVVTIEFKPDASTVTKLEETFPNENFTEVFTSQAIPVTVENTKASTTSATSETTTETTTSSTSTDETTKTSSSDDGTSAAISLVLADGPLKATSGNLKLKVKDGIDVTGTFTAMDTDTFILDEDGRYSIPEKAIYKKLNEEVTFKLDTTSKDALAALPKYKDQTIPSTYKVNVTKKAQKDILITYKNKDINTNLNNVGRLLITDEIDGLELKIKEFTPITNNQYISLDELGNWKSLKTGSTKITPVVILEEESQALLEKKFSDYDLNVTSEEINVTVSNSSSDTSNSNSNKKTGVPVSNLPKTGEEKLRFAGVIGVILIIVVGFFFFFMKKKKNEER